MADKFGDFWKREMIEKPGASLHSAKWDRCVEHVKQSGSAENAYAVCTAMIGDESFKAMGDDEFLAKVDEYVATLGISAGVKNASGHKEKAVSAGYAGDVPNSLLAGQDLDGETTTKVASDSSDTDKSSINSSVVRQMESAVQQYGWKRMGWTGVDVENKLRSIFGEIYRAEARHVGETVLKGQVEEAKKDLIDAAQDTDASKKTIADRIVAAQKKTMGATINAREKAGEAKGKSFTGEWIKSRA